MNKEYMNEDLDESMDEDEVWNRFIKLQEEEMADMAERATAYFFVFKIKDFNESIKRAEWALSEGYKTLAEMVEESVNMNEFTMDDTEAWCVMDAGSGVIKTDSDLLSMLAEYENEIVTGICEDEELVEELRNKPTFTI